MARFVLEDAEPQAAKPQRFVMEPEEPAQNPNPLTSGERFARGMMDPIDGGAQLLTHILPESVVSAGNRLNNWLSDTTGLVAKIPEGGVDQMLSDKEAVSIHAPRCRGAKLFISNRLIRQRCDAELREPVLAASRSSVSWMSES